MGEATRGMDCKLYRNTGNYESPTWVEVTNVQNLSSSDTKAMADASTRANNGYRAEVGTLKTLEVTFGMVYDKEDTNYGAFETAYDDNDPIEVAVLDGDIETPGTKGVRFTAGVNTFATDEPLEGVKITNVTLRPTYAANAPARMTVSS